ncbi:MAG: thiol reductant ABC exporter subunit CydC [Coriobacteriales bacterium]|jgi:ATP-binding cassette subfamily C protein CydC
MAEEKRRDAWVRPYFSRYKRQLWLAIGLGVATYLFAALLMFFAGYLICRTAEEQNGVFMVMAPIAAVQLFGIGKPILRYIERLVGHDWVFRMTSSLRYRLYGVFERRTRPNAGVGRLGAALGLVAEDIGHIQNLYLRVVFPLMCGWLFLALIVVLLGFASWWFAGVVFLVLFVTAFLLPLVAWLCNRARVEREKASTDRLYDELTDNVLGARDWVFSGRGAEYLERYRSAEGARQRERKGIDAYARGNDLVEMVLYALCACITVAWAAGAFGGSVGGAADWIAAFALGFFPLIEVFSPMAMSAVQAQGHVGAIGRLNELGDAKGQLSFEPKGESLDDEAPEPVLQDSVLRVEDAWFSYRVDKPVLRGVDFEVAPGDKVAILGRSGSGKSTLAGLMRGDLIPDHGRVELGGVATAELGDAMAHHLAVVQQSPYVFDMTLKENLLLAAPDADDETLMRALGAVGLDGLVEGLPDGLDTRAFEAGARFSGGERHRLALARVLLTDAPLVLFDEPFTALDPITEGRLLDTLFSTMEDRGIVLITHHLQGIERFDRVVFLEEGRIALDGSPDKLVESSERFRRLLAFDRGLM